MQIKPIRTARDYARALKEIEADWETNFPEGGPEGDRYEVLLTLVEAYESRHFPVPDPDPILAIKIRMEDRDLDHRDLLPIFGTRSRVYEVLNKMRGLSIEHIRELNKRLNIPVEILLKKYRLKGPKVRKTRAIPKGRSRAA
ncbi:MAG TPA: transcriptional regulator [Polyangiaceae bacterium]